MNDKKIYPIFAEGFVATCESGEAKFEGLCVGLDFKDACKSFFKDNEYYDETRNTLWGCRLFDNLNDAQKGFG